METITINYKELTDALTKLEEDYPSRMHGHIDLLRANLKYNLKQFLSSNILTVELDNKTKTAFIGGEPITGNVYALYNTNEIEPTTSEKMYVQIIEAKKEAERLGIYERVFGRVEETDNMKDKTVINKNSDGHSIDLNEVVRAVCLDGDCYSKYSQAVRESYGIDTEAKVRRFLDELGFSRFEFKSPKMTDTYYLSLNYLGEEIGLDKKTIAGIIHWQSQNVERWHRSICFGKRTDLIILVIGSNVSMKEMTPLHIPKSEKVDKEVQEIIEFYQNLRDFGDASLAIVNYAGYAKVGMWPTRFKDMEKNNCPCTTIIDGEKCYVSDGLEVAMRLAILYEGVMPFSQTYIVLVSDGADDDSARTQAILDLIKEKRTIEYYTYFVETLGRQDLTDQIKKKFHDSMGRVSLKEPLAHSLDWWVDRDVMPYSWYGHESYYGKYLHSNNRF